MCLRFIRFLKQNLTRGVAVCICSRSLWIAACPCFPCQWHLALCHMISFVKKHHFVNIWSRVLCSEGNCPSDVCPWLLYLIESALLLLRWLELAAGFIEHHFVPIQAAASTHFKSWQMNRHPAQHTDMLLSSQLEL
jgi:hypothetical protein